MPFEELDKQELISQSIYSKFKLSKVSQGDLNLKFYGNFLLCKEATRLGHAHSNENMNTCTMHRGL